jgi:glutaconate CoA-transferase, subunit A
MRRPSPTKVRSLPDALSLVGDGAHVALGGFAITRCAVAAVHELIRAGRRGLTLSQAVAGLDTDLLVGAGCADRLVYAGGSLDRFGPLYAISHAVAAGSLRTEEYSSLAMTLRYHAGALGLPFIPSRSLLGSDLLAPLIEIGAARMGEDPFSGRPVVLLPPLRPDVAVLHVDVADESGNAALRGPTWTVREVAFAARAVIVLCEQLVPVGSIAPEEAIIPGAVVSAVAVVPRGAHPTAVLGRYDYDRRHLEEYVDLARLGQRGVTEYVDRYVRGVTGHDEYLARAGVAEAS